MGRPNQCNTCCDGVDPPTDPPIGDCDKVICIAVIDSNNNSNGRDTFESKMAHWIIAFPSRLLFVMDVYIDPANNPDGTPKLYYPPNFLSSDESFSLRQEKLGGLGTIPEFVARDNGDTGSRTDIWDACVKIKNSKSAAIQALFADSTQVSYFIADTSTMDPAEVRAAEALLRTEIVDAGKQIVSSIGNITEDVLCPFSQGNCCTNSSAGDLLTSCGYTNTCGVDSISFTASPSRMLFRDYCPDKEEICTACELTNYKEANEQARTYTAGAFNSAGEQLFDEMINYDLQYQDEATGEWMLAEDLPNALSFVAQELDALIDNWPPVGDCHKWLGGTACNSYTDYANGDCITRKFTRNFRLKAADLTDSVVGYSTQFYLYEYFTSDVPTGGQWVIVPADTLDGHIHGIRENDRTGLGSDTPSESQTVDLSYGGESVVVGTPLWDGPTGDPLNLSSNYGYVRVFHRDATDVNSKFIQRGDNIENPSPVEQDKFGTSVSMNRHGNIVAVGAPNKTGSGGIRGQVYVYKFNAGGWTQHGNIIETDQESLFGHNICLNDEGDRIIIGSPYWSDDEGPGGPGTPDEPSILQHGRAQVFELVGSTWTQLGSDLIGIDMFDWAGADVSLDDLGNIAAVGIPGWQMSTVNEGAVRVYEYDGSEWAVRGGCSIGNADNQTDGPGEYDECWKHNINDDNEYRAIAGDIPDDSSAYLPSEGDKKGSLVSINEQGDAIITNSPGWLSTVNPGGFGDFQGRIDVRAWDGLTAFTGKYAPINSDNEPKHLVGLRPDHNPHKTQMQFGHSIALARALSPAGGMIIAASTQFYDPGDCNDDEPRNTYGSAMVFTWDGSNFKARPAVCAEDITYDHIYPDGGSVRRHTSYYGHVISLNGDGSIIAIADPYANPVESIKTCITDVGDPIACEKIIPEGGTVSIWRWVPD